MPCLCYQYILHMWSSHVPRNVQLEANVEVEYRVHGACPVGPHHRGGYYTTNFFPRVVSVSLQFLFAFHYTTPVAKFVPVRGSILPKCRDEKSKNCFYTSGDSDEIAKNFWPENFKEKPSFASLRWTRTKPGLDHDLPAHWLLKFAEILHYMHYYIWAVFKTPVGCYYVREPG